MIKVYGASDDLVEIDGDIYEEFVYDDNDDDGTLLAFSNGLVLRVRYTASGVWRINLVTGNSNLVEIVPAPEDDDDDYSDVAHVDSADWVVAGRAWARRR